MSKLQELIKELCPEGVEFRKLWNVTIWDKKFNSVDKSKQPKVISYPYLLAKELFLLEQCNGNVFLLSTGEQTGWTTEELAGDYLCVGEVVTIPWGKSRKVSEVMKYYKGKFVTADNRIATSNDTSILSNKYLYYWLLTQSDSIDKCYRGAGIQHPDMSKILDFEIPLPPLEIQNEIVRILDTFTSHAAELQAELQARKEQYEYYRNKLLTFDENDEGVKWMKLGEIGTFVRGNGLQKKDFTETGFPCIHYGQIHTYYCTSANSTISYTSNSLAEKLRKASYGDLIIATTSEDVDCVCKACAWLGENDVAISGDAYVFRHNQNPKYVSYLFQTKLFYELKKKAATGTKVIRVSGESMEKFLLPFPPFSEQQRIVSILDKFESLVNDLTAGLPAEIAAVQEQYEYYRNKLLTFERKS